ncbi:unnamed protein product [Rotaria sordida]|uniref:Glycine-rich domain-containing protein-like n=1 Tax=Rotaria sordida TaxID=392033 RepID=A0A819TE10_9BILA|nr:unnamed protein product [Rotaria sordida]CAF4077515.1 unnamed protein product [Rotaria sordida]
MGSAPSSSIPNFDARIRTKEGKKFRISYHDLVDHILLLRQVIAQPELSQEGPVLDHFINDYCNRMAQQNMKNKHQQLKLPLEIEWIWHVHRLHPLIYHNDCTTQLPGRKLVDKKVRKVVRKHENKHNANISFSSINSYLTFVPSINLRKAIIRQRDFLEKFQEHYLYSFDLKKMNHSDFEHLVQNYVSFIKLAQKNEMIVPTFDIDLIWHTHMRYPSQYQTVSTALCGFILDHNDAIESNILTHAYQKTAKRWKKTYKLEYGQNIDRRHLETSQYMSSCAMVFVPIHISSGGGASSCGAIGGGCGSSCGGGGCDGGGGCGGGGCDGGGCGGGGCGGGCGGGGD